MTRQDAFSEALAQSYQQLGATFTVIQFGHKQWGASDEMLYDDSSYYPLKYEAPHTNHLGHHRIIGAVTSPDGVTFTVTYTGGV